MTEPATASLASVYAFGIRTSQAIFVQDTISLFADPLFELFVAAVGIDDPASGAHGAHGASGNSAITNSSAGASGNGANGASGNGAHGAHGAHGGHGNQTCHGTMYRALRVLFRFLVAIVSIRLVGFALGIT
jgi:hypothetical protein